jgi:acyl carrier protein
MAETVEERVRRVFAEFKKVPVEEITMDTTFEELGFDSLDGLNLVFELEEEFDLTVPDDKVQEMRSVRQAVEGIEMLVAAKEQGIDVAAVAAEEFAAKQAEFRKQKEAKAAGKTKKTKDAPTETEQAGDAPAADNAETADETPVETKAEDGKKKRRRK